MRQFGRIETAIWQNPKFRALSDDGRILWFYMLCCPHGNAVGCYVLPDGYIMADLGWSPERVAETVSELFRNGLIERDEGTYLTRVRGWWGHNTIENGNVAKGAVKAILALPRCPVFFRFINDIERFPEQLANALRNAFPNGLPNGSETKEPEMEPEKESSVPSLRSGTSAAAPGVDRVEAKPPLQAVPNPLPVEPPAVRDGGDAIPLFLRKPPGGDWKALLFKDGLAWLAEVTEEPPAKLRPLLGKWLKQAGDDAQAVWKVMADCQREERADPKTWIIATLNARAGEDGDYAAWEESYYQNVLIGGS